MKAIQTKFIGATNTRGSRVTVRDGDGNSTWSSYDHGMNAERNHAAGAKKLCDKMKWTGAFVSGWLKAGTYVHVFLETPKE